MSPSARVLAVEDPDSLERATAALVAGAVVGVPTDTVYGLAVRAQSAAAVEGLFALKGRPETVAIAVLVAGVDQAATLTDVLTDAAHPAATLAARFWPGPLTLVVDRRSGLDLALGGDETSIGLRVPDLPAVRALAAAVGPLAVTSANRHGQPTCVTAAEVAELVGPLAGEALLVLDGGVCDGAPSSVVRVRHHGIELLREGGLSRHQITDALTAGGEP